MRKALYLGAVLALGLAGCGHVSHPAARTATPKAERPAVSAFSREVARGRRLFADTSLGTNGRSCQSCHADYGLKAGKPLPSGRVPASLVGVAAEFPRVGMGGQVTTLSEQVSRCLQGALLAKPETPLSPRVIAIESYLASLAKGKALWNGEVPANGPLAAAIARGKALFAASSLGKNGKSCLSCHADYGRKAGTALPNGTVPPSLRGVAAGFPKVNRRGEVVNLGLQVEGCLRNGLGGASLPPGSNRLTDLETYLYSLSAGAKLHPGT